MNKKILMSTIVLLALSMVLISPVKAKTKEPYTSHMELELKDPGKRWVSEEGIYQIRNSYSSGTYEDTLGTGTWESWVSLSIDLATGEGTIRGKFKITIGTSTLSGRSRGKVEMSQMPQFSGTFVGTLGTGDFEGAKIRGLWWGFHPDGNLSRIVMDAEGTIKYP